MKYNSEEQFVNGLEQELIKLNYKTFREVVPDECVGWEKPYRVDLIFWHPIHGFIAIEAKNIRSLRQGAIFAQAVRQIEVYKKMHFFNGKTISKWCVSVPQSVDMLFDTNEKEKVLKEINFFITGFLRNMYDISILNGLCIDPYTPVKIDIEYNDSGKFPPVNYNEEFRCSSCDTAMDIEDKQCPCCLKLRGDNDADS
jgi:hypothetical protein